MTFTQTTFLGASICNFNASIGWGNQVSTLSVELVEDPSNGDSFNPPTVGSPVYFEYNDWHFGGLLQSYSRKYGQGGNPLISVQVQDPRTLLEGVQLILNDYSSTVSVENLYNVYGYLESTYGFGGSLVNDTGIPWKYVRDAFIAMQITNPISFRGESFWFFPFQGLDVLPDYYRIAGDCISVMDFVNDICMACGRDYFIGMTYEPATGYPNYIGVNTISRRNEMRSGAIAEFIASTDGAVAKDIGYELRNEVSSKFVVGGKVCQLYFQEQANTENDVGKDAENPDNIMYDNTIMPYWGHDCNGSLILQNQDGTFCLDGRELYLTTGIPQLINYRTDIGEMRIALKGQDEWESYLWWNSGDETSIHYAKGALLNLKSGFSNAFKDYLKRVRGIDPNLWDTIPRPLSILRTGLDAIDDPGNIDRVADKVYEFVHRYASEYYGRKFMVRIPFVLGKIVPETNNQIVFSVEPTDGGYVEESNFGQMASRGLMPQNVEQFILEDNRIQGYVRFTGFEIKTNEEVDIPYTRRTFGLGELSPEDYIVDFYVSRDLRNVADRIFVKCELDPNLVFLNSTTLFSPRVVVTLPGPVASNINTYDNIMWAQRVVVQWLMQGTQEFPSIFDRAGAEAASQRLFFNFAGELNWFCDTYPAATPDLAVLPLQSNILRYGPWQATGSAGRVEYETDDTLVPWNYGSYDTMNLVGRSKVDDVVVNQTKSEFGSVEFPGTPSKQLGHELVDSGPAVTDINVNIGEQGVTTTYRMNTWTPQFGTLAKYNIERFLKIGKLAQEQRRAFRRLFVQGSPLRYFKTMMGNVALEYKRARRYGNRSSSNMIAGDVIVTGSGTTLSITTNAAGIAGYRLSTEMTNDNYKNKAGISMDGLFVPYTTRHQATISGVLCVEDSNGVMVSGDSAYNSYLPHFENPAAGATSPTIDSLNPFGGGGICMALKEAETIPSDLDTELSGYSGHVKGVGIKAPIIVGGWGYDINGNPVPSGGTTGSFLTNYKTRADQWKVGPLDIRWDDDRKVWTSIGSSSTSINIKPFKLLSGLTPGGYASARPYVINTGWNSGINPFVEDITGSPTTVYDFLLATGRQQYTNDKILAAQMTIAVSGSAAETKTLWVVINGQVNC